MLNLRRFRVSDDNAETVDIKKLTTLLSYYNKLVRRFELPKMIIDLEYDSSYTLYFDGPVGCFSIFEKDMQLQFGLDMESGDYEKGFICDHDYFAVAKMIKRIEGEE
jgi:hypothetical protein